MDDLEQDMSPEDLMLSFVSAERGKVLPLSTPPLPRATSDDRHNTSQSISWAQWLTSGVFHGTTSRAPSYAVC